jgi:hypothetical protein
MNFQLILSETRFTHGHAHDHVTDVAECEDPEALIDVMVGRWRLSEGVMPGGKKVVVCAIHNASRHDCWPGAQHEVSFYDGKPCVKVGASAWVEFIEWCKAQNEAQLKRAEDHVLGSD